MALTTRADASAWFEENVPPPPEFMLPLTFMEVGTDAQFYFLCDWQNKVYEAGYLGAAWPKEYGGGGKPQIYQDIATAEMARQRVPFVLNTIGLNWAGPLTFMEVGTDQQFEFLRDWQRKIYEAGYLGMAWPKEMVAGL